MKTHCGLGCDIMEPLATVEQERIRRHARMGFSIMEGVDSPMLQMAASIARTHHENGMAQGIHWASKATPSRWKAESRASRMFTMHCVANVLTSPNSRSKNALKSCFPNEAHASTLKSLTHSSIEFETLNGFGENTTTSTRQAKLPKRKPDSQPATDLDSCLPGTGWMD